MASMSSSAQNPWEDPSEENNFQRYLPLYKAIQNGNWETTNLIVTNDRNALTAKISYMGKRPLHVAAQFKHLQVFKNLVRLMSEDEMELKDEDGSTALIQVCAVGITEMAKCMVNGHRRILTVSRQGDNLYILPVTAAVLYGHKDMARYLYSVTPLEILLTEDGKFGSTLLIHCLHAKYLDIALELLQRYPSLAITKNGEGSIFVTELAAESSIFPSGCELSFFKQWIYNWINIKPITATVNQICINIQSSNTRDGDCNISLTCGINQIYETKLLHKQSEELLRITCDHISTLNPKSMVEILNHPILLAAREGNPEFIIEVAKAIPEIVWSFSDDCMNFFFNAVQHRQAKVFNLIYGFIWKDDVANMFDTQSSNTLLHMAGMKAPPSHLNRISGAALQMQREIQWFKEVESIMPPARKKCTNNNNETARDLFTKEHKKLVKEGEEWMKGTATSCTVVGALIITIMFAATFTVPGGNDQDTGYPIFKDKKSFIFFIISNAISLFSSSTSVLMFLGILTSRYAEDDFLKLLPTKLITGLSLLFISIAAMMATFCAALFIILEGKLWIIVPVILLAGVPIGLFVRLQFPLLVEIFISTFGPGIFNTNRKHWL